MLQIDIFFFFRNGHHVVFERVFGTEKTLRFFFRIEFLSIFFIPGDRSDGNKFSFHQITRHIAAKRRKKIQFSTWNLSFLSVFFFSLLVYGIHWLQLLRSSPISTSQNSDISHLHASSSFFFLIRGSELPRRKKIIYEILSLLCFFLSLRRHEKRVIVVWDGSGILFYAQMPETWDDKKKKCVWKNLKNT